VGESSYGLIVEGTYDENVFPEFVRKIESSEVTLEVRPCGGVPRLLSRFPGFLREFEHVMQGKPVDKALVIRDCGGRDPDSVEREMAGKVRGRQFAFPRAVQFYAVRQMMDTWLLADVHAINSLARELGGRDVAQVQGELEEIGNPKQRLRRLLTQARLPYDPEVCREIARRADLGAWRYRGPSFRRFEEEAKDC
jgi:hypothetical protein